MTICDISCLSILPRDFDILACFMTATICSYFVGGAGDLMVDISIKWWNGILCLLFVNIAMVARFFRRMCRL